MAKKRQWTWALDRRIKPKVPEDVKTEVERQATALIEKHLKPRYIKPLPQDGCGNYLTGIHTKWHRSFFYLVADLASLGPGALWPGFEGPSPAWSTCATAASTWPTSGTPGSGGKSTRTCRWTRR